MMSGKTVYFRFKRDEKVVLIFCGEQY